MYFQPAAMISFCLCLCLRFVWSAAADSSQQLGCILTSSTLHRLVLLMSWGEEWSRPAEAGPNYYSDTDTYYYNDYSNHHKSNYGYTSPPVPHPDSHARGGEGDRYGKGKGGDSSAHQHGKGQGGMPEGHRGYADGYGQQKGEGHGGKGDFPPTVQHRKGTGGHAAGYSQPQDTSHGGNAHGYGQQKGKDHDGSNTQHGWRDQAKGGHIPGYKQDGNIDAGKGETRTQAAQGSQQGYPANVGDRHFDPQARPFGLQTTPASSQEPPPKFGYHLDGQVDNRDQLPRLLTCGEVSMTPWSSERGHARRVMKEVRRLFFKVHMQSPPRESPGPDVPVWPCVHNPYQHAQIKPISMALTWVGRAIQLRLDNNVELTVESSLCGALWPFVNFVRQFQRLHPDHPDRNTLYTFPDELRPHRYMFQPNAHYTIALVLLYISQHDTEKFPGQCPHFKVFCNDLLPDTDPKKIQVWVRPGSDKHAWHNEAAMKMGEKMKTPVDLPPRPANRLLRRWDMSACRKALGLPPLEP